MNVFQGGEGKEEDRVDYESLGKLVIRMGRAFNAIVQEKTKADDEKFPPLLNDLKKYFQELSKEKPQGRSGLIRVAVICNKI